MLRAAIFDLDGLLVDREPLWRRAEIEHFATVGLALTDAECAETTGLRIDEGVALRHRQRPWETAAVDVLTARIVDRMVALLVEGSPAKPGGAHAIDVCPRAGLRVAVASSSPLRLIEAALAGLGVRERFELVVSAEREPYGKPHPAVFLRTAELLGVAPGACDSAAATTAAPPTRTACTNTDERGESGSPTSPCA